MSFQVFISYSTKDISHVEQINQICEEAGAQTFFAEQSLVPGESLDADVISAIKSSDLFLLLWSKNSRESEWVQQEIGIAIAENKKIIPVALEPNLQMPGFIKDLKYLPFYNDPAKRLSWLKQNLLEQESEKRQSNLTFWIVVGIVGLIFLSKD